MSAAIERAEQRLSATEGRLAEGRKEQRRVMTFRGLTIAALAVSGVAIVMAVRGRSPKRLGRHGMTASARPAEPIDYSAATEGLGHYVRDLMSGTTAGSTNRER